MALLGISGWFREFDLLGAEKLVFTLSVFGAWLASFDAAGLDWLNRIFDDRLIG